MRAMNEATISATMKGSMLSYEVHSGSPGALIALVSHICKESMGRVGLEDDEETFWRMVKFGAAILGSSTSESVAFDASGFSGGV